MAQFERKESFFEAARELCSNPNFSILVSTAIGQMAIYQAIEPFTMLYLRDIGISYFQIGLLEVVYSLLVFTSIVGPYLADTLPQHRSKFAAANSLSWGIMCLIYSIASGFWQAAVVFFIAGISFGMFSAASRTYMLEQSPSDKHHFAMGFYTLYRIPLIIVFVLLLRSIQVYGFVPGMRRALFLGGGIIILIGALRWIFLKDTESKSSEKSHLTLKGLIKENTKTLRWLWKIAPIFMIISMLDAISDALYNFLIYFFLNEVAAIPEAEILKGRLILDFISTPLILYLAFRISRKREKKPMVLILYIFVPIAILLLLFSSVYPDLPLPNYIPFAFQKLAFFAYSIKTIQDFLWMHILLTPIAVKVVPKQHMAKALGMAWLLVEGARIIASPLAGWIYENYINGAVIILYLILALNFLIIFTITKYGSDFEYNSSQEN